MILGGGYEYSNEMVQQRPLIQRTVEVSKQSIDNVWEFLNQQDSVTIIIVAFFIGFIIAKWKK